MKQQRDFEFNLRELAGSRGDFGTLFPLAIGLIAVNGLNPAGLFIKTILRQPVRKAN